MGPSPQCPPQDSHLHLPNTSDPNPAHPPCPQVRALVRNKEKEGAAEALPQSVEVVEGDIADYKACRRAVEGVDKVRERAAQRAQHVQHAQLSRAQPRLWL